MFRGSREVMRGRFMNQIRLAVALTAGMTMTAFMGSAQNAPSGGLHKVLKTAKAAGEGGYDYIFADSGARRRYVPRGGPAGRLTVFDLDTLEPAGTIPDVRAGGATVDPKSHHGFSTTKPITMWDATTLKVIKTIDVGGRPDGILCDPYNARIWVLSHQPPHATVIDAAEGTVVKTLDLGGAPEQAVSDGKGTIYVNIADKATIAVLDTKTFIKENSPTSFTVEQTLPTMAGAKTLALDTKTNHLLTMAAEFGPPPPDASPGPAGRPARGPMIEGSFSILMVGK